VGRLVTVGIHPGPINPVFYRSPRRSLFRGRFVLRCFQLLSATA
jgi:hypothetical protein